MSARAPLSKDLVIDAFVLCLSRTSMRDVVAPDALRTVLSAEYSTIVHDGAFHLEAVWELLHAQPGFEPKGAYPGMFLFKSLEARLGIKVELPAELASVPPTERATFAAMCPVKSEEIDLVLEPARASASSSSPAVKGPSLLRQAVSSVEKPEKTWGRRRPLDPARQRRIMSITGGVLACSLVIVTLSLTAGGPKLHWSEVSPATFDGALPATAARRVGTQVNVTVSDAWFGRSEDERSRDLANALSRMDLEVSSVLIEDGQKQMRASVQRNPQTGAPRVRFYR